VFHQLKNLYQEGIESNISRGITISFSILFSPISLDGNRGVSDGCEEKLDGKKAFIAHGDLSNPGSGRIGRSEDPQKLVDYRLIHLAARISRAVARKLSDMSYQKYHQQHVPPPPFKTFAHQKFLEGF